MKYVSPIFEVVALETKDIICASATNPLVTPGVVYKGNDNAAIEAAQNAQLIQEEDAETGELKTTGVSVSVSFNNLFKSSN